MKLLFGGFLALLLFPAYGQPSTIARLRNGLQKAQHDTTQINLYIKLVERHVYSNHKLDSVYYWANKGIALARQHNRTASEGKFLMLLGYYYKRLSQYAKAQSIYLKALKLSEKSGNQRLHLDILYALACVYLDQGMYQKCIETASGSLQLAERLTDNYSRAMAYQLLALSHLNAKNIPTALTYATHFYKVSKELAAHKPDFQNLVTFAEVTISEIYEVNGNYAQAYPYLKKNFNYFLKIKDTNQTSEACLLISKNLIRQNRPREAIRQLDECRKRNLIIPDASFNYEIYARAYQQLGQPRKALFYASIAYSRALKNGNLNQTKAVLQALITTEESLKLYPQAMAHLRQLTAINDSLFTRQKSQLVAEVEAKYQVRQQENMIELLQKNATLRQVSLEKRNRELEVRRQQQIVLIMFILMLLISVIGLWFIFKRERVTRSQLAIQKTEIEDNARQLEQANQLKDKLFGIIGHDLRSPIASLKTQLMGVQEGYISVKSFKQRSSQLVQMVDNVYLTLDNLLHWSMLQRNSLLARPVRFDLAELAEAVVRLYYTELDTKQLTLTTHFEYTPVFADEMQLQIVVRNLLHNAIKFTPPNKSIRLSTHQNGGQALFTIADSGVGMCINRLASTLNPVVTSRGTAGERGTGLGLELCREFVRLNKGQLVIDSELDKGTTITIQFSSSPNFT